ncbi:hypothetical protein BDZ94DRAFT_1252572 [Collybia nuda]|uniref:Uncharacterized protein n=1 Tax=Collybia nuda TaxID=64659 RepID=A0A9P6CH13_9AGAR|nr:hypothetical protein BDZ94DRAFT_1252572 [Collybia nuda]
MMRKTMMIGIRINCWMYQIYLFFHKMYSSTDHLHYFTYFLSSIVGFSTIPLRFIFRSPKFAFMLDPMNPYFSQFFWLTVRLLTLIH